MPFSFFVIGLPLHGYYGIFLFTLRPIFAIVLWLLSPTHFNIYLESIMADALKDHEGTVSNGGRAIINLCFADDINGLGDEEELAKLVKHLNKASTAYGMKVSTEKTKLMTNTTSSINKKIKVN